MYAHWPPEKERAIRLPNRLKNPAVASPAVWDDRPMAMPAFAARVHGGAASAPTGCARLPTSDAALRSMTGSEVAIGEATGSRAVQATECSSPDAVTIV